MTTPSGPALPRSSDAAVRCWLARFSRTACHGRLVRVHLIPRQLLRREGHKALIEDPRTWVLGCGGPMGNGGHHGMLDQSRTLRIPRAALPEGLEQLAGEIGLGWWLDREYGGRDDELAADAGG